LYKNIKPSEIGIFEFKPLIYDIKGRGTDLI